MMEKNTQNLYGDDFYKISKMIEEVKSQVLKDVNKSLILLYWNIGKYVSGKVEQGEWGLSVVEDLSEFIRLKQTNVKGFSARNIWRMKQFYEAYKNYKKLSTLLTEISWSSHLHILSKTKTIEEKEFYLNLFSSYPYSVRECERVIDSCTYERTSIGNKKLSSVLAEFPKPTGNLFKDIYTFEFLDLPQPYKENDLRKELLKNLSKFLLEMGPDFSLIGEEYVVQVGGRDFRIDLLLHNRALNCLVAVELKTTEFQPEYLGKIQFYLEALDRDVKKDHEHPSIGILICKTKDEEVVRYALSRHISPTMIAEYETKLMEKEHLQRKLHEISEYLASSWDEK
jgi:predicted nuclease of restriction endonuclease-like (RecB) superfamily